MQAATLSQISVVSRALDRCIARSALAKDVRVTSLIAQLNSLSKEFVPTELASYRVLLKFRGCDPSYDSSYEIPREPPRGWYFEQMLQVSMLLRSL
jgi:hypothetical protein